MKAIILAAGRGIRMQELTINSPKCLLKIRGKSLLERQIYSLKKAGIYDIAIVTGYKNNMLADYGLKEFHNSRWYQTQMFYSLTKAQSWLKNYPCIISYSDIFYDSEIVNELIISNNELAISYDKNWYSLWSQRFENPLEDAESFKKNKDNFLIEIGQKVNYKSDIEGQYMGLIKVTPNGWKKLECIYQSLDINSQEKIHFTKILNYALAKYENLIKVIPVNSNWGEVDTKDDLFLYNKVNE